MEPRLANSRCGISAASSIRMDVRDNSGRGSAYVLPAAKDILEKRQIALGVHRGKHIDTVVVGSGALETKTDCSIEQAFRTFGNLRIRLFRSRRNEHGRRVRQLLIRENDFHCS